MRILANENLPGDAVSALREGGHDVAWVHSDAPGSSDVEGLERTQRESLYQRGTSPEIEAEG